jgi:hypothetical protein
VRHPVAEARSIPLIGRGGEITAYALIDEVDAHLESLTWRLQGRRYAVRSENGQVLLMHRGVLDAPPGVEVDHINRNGLDNRRANLRLATRAENTRNAKLSKRNTSGFRGVSCDRFTGRWLAIVRSDRRTYRLGSFATPEEAAIAYDFAAAALHGEFASTNFSLSAATKACLGEFRAFLMGNPAETLTQIPVVGCHPSAA